VFAAPLVIVVIRRSIPVFKWTRARCRHCTHRHTPFTIQAARLPLLYMRDGTTREFVLLASLAPNVAAITYNYIDGSKGDRTIPSLTKSTSLLCRMTVSTSPFSSHLSLFVWLTHFFLRRLPLYCPLPPRLAWQMPECWPRSPTAETLSEDICLINRPSWSVHRVHIIPSAETDQFNRNGMSPDSLMRRTNIVTPQQAPAPSRPTRRHGCMYLCHRP
jgi:hypothetical protein